MFALGGPATHVTDGAKGGIVVIGRAAMMLIAASVLAKQDGCSKPKVNEWLGAGARAVKSTATTVAGAAQGASARCNDGTYSKSQHRSGTCSRHGGVKQWLKEVPK